MPAFHHSVNQEYAVKRTMWFFAFALPLGLSSGALAEGIACGADPFLNNKD